MTTSVSHYTKLYINSNFFMNPPSHRQDTILFYILAETVLTISSKPNGVPIVHALTTVNKAQLDGEQNSYSNPTSGTI